MAKSIESNITAQNDRFAQLRKNQARLTKDELVKIKSDLESNGKSSKKIDALLDNFDTIDVDQDGITDDEFQTYTKGGLPSGATKNRAASNSTDDSSSDPLLSDEGPSATPNPGALSPSASTVGPLLAAELEASTPTLLDYFNENYNSDGSTSTPAVSSALLPGIEA